MNSIEYIGSSSNGTYYFKIVEEGEVFFVSGVNQSANSRSLRFVLNSIMSPPPDIRFHDSFRLYGQGGALTTEWQGEEYQSQYNLMPQTDGSIILTSTPQMTYAEAAEAARAEAQRAAAASNPVVQAATTPAPPVASATTATTATTARTGMGIGALVLGAFALYALLS